MPQERTNHKGGGGVSGKRAGKRSKDTYLRQLRTSVSRPTPRSRPRSEPPLGWCKRPGELSGERRSRRWESRLQGDKCPLSIRKSFKEKVGRCELGSAVWKPSQTHRAKGIVLGSVLASLENCETRRCDSLSPGPPPLPERCSSLHLPPRLSRRDRPGPTGLSRWPRRGLGPRTSDPP